MNMRNYADSYHWLEVMRGDGFGPVIVTCALNGGGQGKEANEAIPETVEEIAQAAYDAYNAGAAAVHVHGRDPAKLWDATMDPDLMLEINAAIRERCPDLIINNTTGGGPSVTMDDRFEGLRARPELASLNMGPDMSRFTVRPRPESAGHPHDGYVYDDCLPWTYAIIGRLAKLMLELEVKPELEIFNPGQHWVTQFLIGEGLLQPPYFHQFVMGYQTASYPTPQNLIGLVRELPAGSIFSVCGIGQYQLPMTTLSILLGGHIRVGLEDNIYYSRGRKLAGNGEAVERAVRIASEHNRGIASPAQAREILGISDVPREYEVAAVPAGGVA